MYDNCGQLQDSVCILTPKWHPDDQGNTVRTWDTWLITKAQARDRSGRELYTGAQVQAEKQKDFKIRWHAGLTEGMAVEYHGAVYEITDIDHLGNQRRGWMLLRTKRVKAEGGAHGDL